MRDLYVYKIQALSDEFERIIDKKNADYIKYIYDFE